MPNPQPLWRSGLVVAVAVAALAGAGVLVVHGVGGTVGHGPLARPSAPGSAGSIPPGVLPSPHAGPDHLHHHHHPHHGPSVAPSPRGPLTVFRLSTFNVLGASHTRATGDKAERPSGPLRMDGAVRLVARHHVDVVGFQELEPVQAARFEELTGARWRLFPGLERSAGDVRDSLAWRTDRWDLVHATTVGIPYFTGHEVQMPVVQLRNRLTGARVWFVNVHNPADTRRFPRQAVFRNQALEREIALVRRLHAHGVPVLLTGDMNAREDYFCAMAARGAMVAANGGAVGPDGCRPPAEVGIDWIFGSRGVLFSGLVRDHGGLVQRASDHPFYAVTVTLPIGQVARGL